MIDLLRIYDAYFILNIRKDKHSISHPLVFIWQENHFIRKAIQNVMTHIDSECKAWMSMQANIIYRWKLSLICVCMYINIKIWLNFNQLFTSFYYYYLFLLLLLCLTGFACNSFLLLIWRKKCKLNFKANIYLITCLCTFQLVCLFYKIAKRNWKRKRKRKWKSKRKRKRKKCQYVRLNNFGIF